MVETLTREATSTAAARLRSATSPLRAIGLMSGTSLDGIDAALVETDGREITRPGRSLTIPYPPDFRRRLRGILGGTAPAAEIQAVERILTELHADAVAALRRSLESDGVARSI
jgi:anhydro-N-acetylmuramic acid kinase